MTLSPAFPKSTIGKYDDSETVIENTNRNEDKYDESSSEDEDLIFLKKRIQNRERSRKNQKEARRTNGKCYENNYDGGDDASQNRFHDRNRGDNNKRAALEDHSFLSLQRFFDAYENNDETNHDNEGNKEIGEGRGETESRSKDRRQRNSHEEDENGVRQSTDTHVKNFDIQNEKNHGREKDNKSISTQEGEGPDKDNDNDAFYPNDDNYDDDDDYDANNDIDKKNSMVQSRNKKQQQISNNKYDSGHLNLAPMQSLLQQQKEKQYQKRLQAKRKQDENKSIPTFNNFMTTPHHRQTNQINSNLSKRSTSSLTSSCGNHSKTKKRKRSSLTSETNAKG